MAVTWHKHEKIYLTTRYYSNFNEKFTGSNMHRLYETTIDAFFLLCPQRPLRGHSQIGSEEAPLLKLGSSGKKLTACQGRVSPYPGQVLKTPDIPTTVLRGVTSQAIKQPSKKYFRSKYPNIPLKDVAEQIHPPIKFYTCQFVI